MPFRADFVSFDKNQSSGIQVYNYLQKGKFLRVKSE